MPLDPEEIAKGQYLALVNRRILMAYVPDLWENLKRAAPIFVGLLAWLVVATAVVSHLSEGGDELKSDNRSMLPRFAVVEIEKCEQKCTVIQRPRDGLTLSMALYYNTEVMVTIGAADISPLNAAGRAVAFFDSLAGFLLFGTLVSLISNTFLGTAGERPEGESQTSHPGIKQLDRRLLEIRQLGSWLYGVSEAVELRMMHLRAMLKKLSSEHLDPKEADDPLDRKRL